MTWPRPGCRPPWPPCSPPGSTGCPTAERSLVERISVIGLELSTERGGLPRGRHDPGRRGPGDAGGPRPPGPAAPPPDRPGRDLGVPAHHGARRGVRLAAEGAARRAARALRRPGRGVRRRDRRRAHRLRRPPPRAGAGATGASSRPTTRRWPRSPAGPSPRSWTPRSRPGTARTWPPPRACCSRGLDLDLPDARLRRQLLVALFQVQADEERVADMAATVELLRRGHGRDRHRAGAGRLELAPGARGDRHLGARRPRGGGGHGRPLRRPWPVRRVTDRLLVLALTAITNRHMMSGALGQRLRRPGRAGHRRPRPTTGAGPTCSRARSSSTALRRCPTWPARWPSSAPAAR